MRAIVAGSLLALLAGAPAAQAGPVEGFVPENSNIRIVVGGLPPIDFGARKGTEDLATLDSEGPTVNNLEIQRSIWQATSFSPGTSLFTGVPTISDLILTATTVMTTMTPKGGTETIMMRQPPFRNGPGVFNNGFSTAVGFEPCSATGACPLSMGISFPQGGVGGTAPLEGIAIVLALGGAAQAIVGLTPFGGPTGATAMGSIFGYPITVAGGPFVTGTGVIAGVTSNVIQMNTRDPVETGVAFTLNPTTMEDMRTFTIMGGFVDTQTMMAPLRTQMTVTVFGSNVFDGDQGKHFLTLVTPTKTNVQLLDLVIPTAAYESYEFNVVPEPSTILLGLASAAGLVLLGIRRRRAG